MCTYMHKYVILLKLYFFKEKHDKSPFILESLFFKALFENLLKLYLLLVISLSIFTKSLLLTNNIIW